MQFTVFKNYINKYLILIKLITNGTLLDICKCVNTVKITIK